MATVTIWTKEDVFIIDNVDREPYCINGGWTISSSGGDGIDWFEEGSVKRILYDATSEGEEPELDGTTASLKFDIDFSAVEGATRALDRLAMAAVEAERAVDSLNRTMGGTVDKGEW